VQGFKNYYSTLYVNLINNLYKMSAGKVMHSCENNQLPSHFNQYFKSIQTVHKYPPRLAGSKTFLPIILNRHCEAGLPKLFLAMYPFSISIDEHVPLDMGAGRIFFQGGANSGLSRGGPKIFLQEIANSGFSRDGPNMFFRRNQKW